MGEGTIAHRRTPQTEYFQDDVYPPTPAPPTTPTPPPIWSGAPGRTRVRALALSRLSSRRHQPEAQRHDAALRGAQGGQEDAQV